MKRASRPTGHRKSGAARTTSAPEPAAIFWATKPCPIRRRSRPRPGARKANGGGGTRNGEPLYDIAAKRIIHHLVTETPVRTSAVRSLGALPNVFALQCCIDELAERARQDPVQYRLSIIADKRARAVIE